MMTKIRFSLTLMLSIAIAYSAPRARACECFGPSIETADSSQYEAIFSGTALAVEDFLFPIEGTESQRLYPSRLTHFNVATIWQGNREAGFSVLSVSGCGKFFEKGKSYVVFATSPSPTERKQYDLPKGMLMASVCDPNRDLSVDPSAVERANKRFDSWKPPW